MTCIILRHACFCGTALLKYMYKHHLSLTVYILTLKMLIVMHNSIATHYTLNRSITVSLGDCNPSSLRIEKQSYYYSFIIQA